MPEVCGALWLPKGLEITRAGRCHATTRNKGMTRQTRPIACVGSNGQVIAVMDDIYPAGTELDVKFDLWVVGSKFGKCVSQKSTFE